MRRDLWQGRVFYNGVTEVVADSFGPLGRTWLKYMTDLVTDYACRYVTRIAGCVGRRTPTVYDNLQARLWARLKQVTVSCP